MGKRAATLLAVAVAGVALAGSLIAIAVTDDGTPRPPRYPRIAERDATELLAKTVRLAQSGDFARLCQAVAESPRGRCQFLVDDVESQGMMPGPDAPKVLHVKRYPATERQPEILVLRVAGARADGSRYEADFPVTWVDGQSGIKSPTPIYWSGVQFDATSDRCEGERPENEVCAQDTAVAPPWTTSARR